MILAPQGFEPSGSTAVWPRTTLPRDCRSDDDVVPLKARCEGVRGGVSKESGVSWRFFCEENGGFCCVHKGDAYIHKIHLYGISTYTCGCF